MNQNQQGDWKVDVRDMKGRRAQALRDSLGDIDHLCVASRSDPGLV